MTTEDDGLIRMMQEVGIPITREKYIKMAYLGDIPPPVDFRARGGAAPASAGILEGDYALKGREWRKMSVEHDPNFDPNDPVSRANPTIQKIMRLGQPVTKSCSMRKQG
jgi:hypothetical protein